MKKQRFFLTMASVALLLSNAAFLNAQVTVGSTKTPENFSVLELVSNRHNGLRLPQMTTEERDAMANDAFKANAEAQGLRIFNTTTHCIDTWNGYVWISACGPNTVPSPPSESLSTNRVTSYINAMYDFQHQTLTAYLTSGTATAYQWEMSTDGGATWFNIVGATSPNWVIPANFMYDYAGLDKYDKTQGAGNSSIEVFFRCLITDNTGDAGHTEDIYQLKMLFVRTNTAGYGISNGVRFLTINRGVGGGTGNGAIKMALLNLGASGTGAYMNGEALNNDNAGTLNDAGDLGDLYDWGRVADGHEHLVWTKDANYTNIIDPQTGNGATSVAVSGPVPTTDLNTTTGQILHLSSFYGTFVGRNGVWGPFDDDLWGNGSDTRAGAPANLSEWSAKGRGNNPCPSDWYVPSRFDIWDIYRGNGSNDPVTAPSPCFISTADNDNDWALRATYDNSNTCSSIIITNASGEVVLLPALSQRPGTQGVVYQELLYVYYWSSTAGGPSVVYNMQYFPPTFYAGSSSANQVKASGQAVRCVAK